MKTTLLLSADLGLTCALTAQTTFQGNQNSSFGGPVGFGSLEFDDDGTTVTAVHTRGTGSFNNAIALYLDTRPGGITSTANLTDDADLGRSAISGFDGTNRSTITFPTGFEPDFAISIEPTFVGVFELVENGVHGFVTSGNLTAADPNYEFAFDFSQVGAGSSFDFVATYLNPNNAFRSDEAIGTPIAPAGNVGQNPVTFTAFASYSSPVPVSLARFDATPAGAAVELAWATASERDNAGFAVERSTDGASFTEIAFVAGFGDSRTLREYAFRDSDEVDGDRYYRLRQVDFDGQASYSSVVTVAADATVTGADFTLVGASPVREVTTVRNDGPADRHFDVYAQTGQLMASFDVGAGQSYRLDAADFAAGLYLVRSGAVAKTFVKQ